MRHWQKRRKLRTKLQTQAIKPKNVSKEVDNINKEEKGAQNQVRGKLILHRSSKKATVGKIYGKAIKRIILDHQDHA